MQLEPFEKFVLFRGLENHLDSTSYYVQAKIRNGKTAALISTVNLTQDSNNLREFAKEWEVPADVNGTGTYITITYSVYTDSGYTTKSENYADKYDEHLIQGRPNANFIGGAGAGGPDIDYKKIQKMVDESVNRIKFPKIRDVDLQPVLKAIADNKVEIPEEKEIDLKPLIDGQTEIKKSVAELTKRPTFEKTDLSKVFDRLDSLENKVEKLMAFLEKSFENLLEKIKGTFEGSLKKTITVIDAIKEFFEKKISYVLIEKTSEDKKSRNFVEEANLIANNEKSNE